MTSETNGIAVDDGPFTVSGFKLGHWTHPDDDTGCTVLLADQLSPGSVEVRGGAPGSRETDLLRAGRTVQAADAVLLTGGSAFGLSAADGVTRWLRERGRGFPTSAINVPIVAGAVIFDLVGEQPVWPDADAGYAAASAAVDTWESGRRGGGAGARSSKALGQAHAVPTGVGVAQVTTPSGTVSAAFINNAVGDVMSDQDGRLLTSPGMRGVSSEALLAGQEPGIQDSPNTVIGAIVIDRALDHNALTRIAVAGQGGIARVIRPAHSPMDGDTVFALAPETGSCALPELVQLSVAAQIASARALVNAARVGA